MNKSELVTLLCNLNNTNFTDYKGNFEELLQNKFEKISNDLTCSYDDIVEKIPSIVEMYQTEKITYELKYIYLNFYILELLNDELSKSEMEILSVQEIKSVKNALANLMLFGILKNLQPNLPHFVKLENYKEDDVIYTYNLLKCTVCGFNRFIKYPNLRMLIIPHLLQGLLVAMVQIAYCPLKKPTKTTVQEKFVMSQAIYFKLVEDQQIFKTNLEKLRHSIHPSIFIKEIMILLQSDTPVWFKKSISNILTTIMRSKKGVENIALAMLDGTEDDSTKTWKILDVLTKLILNSRKLPDFRENICVQIINLLDLVKTNCRDLLVFERLVISCTKALYYEDEDLCKTVFVTQIMTPLLRFTYKEYKFRADDDDEDDVTDDIKQTVRLIYGCFVDNSANSPCLPSGLLKNVINVIFHFYRLTVKSAFQTTSKELKEILIKHLHSCTEHEINQLFDSFLFGFAVTDVPEFRNDVIIEIDKEIKVKCSQHTIIYTTADVAETVFDLLDTNQKIILFGYLLMCITEKKKYFPETTSQDLLNLEEEQSPTIQRLLIIHHLLSQLADNKDVQISLQTKPDDIIRYINNVLTHHSLKTDLNELVFTVVMILDNLIVNTSKNTLTKYRILLEPISKIAATANSELKSICDKIIVSIRENKVQDVKKPESEITEFDKALEDICDPLLPVRGHALLVLAKLVEKKDKQAMERKQYLLNLFQLSLKNNDSFIYLNAVRGLSALADVFPDTVIEVLCEEFADFTKKSGDDNNETRMKLGEVLVRVTKLLGEMAPKYKSLLLNTFLSGTKDDDHLIRASSLSNLGELCRILNYKLGTIVTEVLVCVHAVITTDKAVEARRAAVTVIRQLFVGLESEMIAFLKEDILPIYRTLKQIYNNDKDDVMRLQAQLALEELNENMKSFIFPKPQINLEKKIIMLD